MFDPVDKNPDYPVMEQQVLRFWDEHKIFEKLREKNRGKPPFSFIDGPITANNPMGVHHAWGRTGKDLFHRFRAMQGRELRYQNGFDCQGLWVEVEVEKELGFTSKRDIEAYGVDRFVEKCKERVIKFAGVQTRQSVRLGYWMDWENSYYTMSDENNHTIWLFLKRCHEDGWLYHGHDVMPWCPRCGTSLSDMEIATEGYREMVHKSAFVKLPLLDQPNTSLLAWTTTPWTLPANVAAAVHPDKNYVRVEQNGQRYIVAEACLARSVRGEYRVAERMSGARLLGLRYQGPFDDLGARPPVEHRVIPWKEVSETEGTGVVHIAPGCGKEDFALGHEFELPVIAPIDEEGRFTAEFGWLAGRRASDVAEDVCVALNRKGLLHRAEDIAHRYPVCWRCGSELLFRLVDEWFISMDELRGRIMKNVSEAEWIPAFCEEREMDWLRNMGDWCISKKRYWGLALPIYACSCGYFEVIGGESELQERAVEGWEEFVGHSPHRPWVDAVKIGCGACGKPVTRVPDVGNPWLDAGIVPFSTLSYRTDPDYWAKWFPAHFVTECFPGQFRNWFYALLTMSTVLENRAPFQTLLGHALVRDENDEEMHKSKGNAIWFDDAAEEMGADVMRWMFASQNVATNLHFGWRSGRETRRKLMTLWNVAAFFVTYANLDRPNLGPVAKRALSDLDRWILSLTQSLVAEVTASLDRYDSHSATQQLERFWEALSNGYVRRCRRRFWKGNLDPDKEAAYQTLYEVLSTMVRLIAPIVPFTAEEIYQKVVRPANPNAPESVHLCEWPTADSTRIDGVLEQDMRAAMRVTRLGLAARNQAGIKVRQPLRRLLVAANDDATQRATERFREAVLDELNVKQIEFVDDGECLRTPVIKPNLSTLGPKWGGRLPAIRAALAAADPEQVASAACEGRDFGLEVAGGCVALEPGEVIVERQIREDLEVAEEGELVVAVDTTVDEELRQEGIARDFVRHIQVLRKESGLEVQDRICLHVDADGCVEQALIQHRDVVQGETLAETMTLGSVTLDGGRQFQLGEQMISVVLRKSENG